MVDSEPSWRTFQSRDGGGGYEGGGGGGAGDGRPVEEEPGVADLRRGGLT